MAAFLRKYNTLARIDGVVLIIKGGTNFKVSPTLATGDVKVSKNGGAFANIASLPSTYPASSSCLRITLSATEMQAMHVVVQFVDAAGAEWEDQQIVIDTYGNASAAHAMDLDDGVRAGLTALPNAAAEAAGGLYTRGTSAGQINQPSDGQVDANAINVGAAGASLTGLGGMSATMKAQVNTEVDSALNTAMPGSPVTDSINDVLNNLKRSAKTLVEGAAIAGTLSTVAMTTDLTEATDDHYNGRIIIWTTGVLAGQATDITDYTGSSKMLTFTAVTEAPSDGDEFVIV